VATIELSQRAIDDLERILDHLLAHDVANAGERVADIVAALDVLRRNPKIGRPAEHEMRELIIGRGTRGYVALYAYDAAADHVKVVAVRGQREAGYG
jgi:plasmid stabilization system protein ParE